jgi:hypothetical protein
MEQFGCTDDHMREKILAEIEACEWGILQAQAGIAEHSAALRNSDPEIHANAQKMAIAFTQREANLRARLEFWQSKLGESEP